MTRISSIAAAIAVVLASIAIIASPADAHERRTVGPYTFVVGWLSEPALIGQTNGLSLDVTLTADGKPVEGLEKTLQADVIVGGGAATRRLELSRDADQPGHYTGGFVPTRIGDYTFRIFGTAGTTPIDARFESGPGRFDTVSDAASLQFPDRLPSATDLAQQLADSNTKVGIAIALAALALVASLSSLVLRKR